jgi:hypothetical protein
MPPPCGVELHVGCYKRLPLDSQDATPLWDGASRLLLAGLSTIDLECPHLTTAMFTQAYRPHELHFAYCYRVYFRWQTFRKLSCPPLARLTAEL